MDDPQDPTHQLPAATSMPGRKAPQPVTPGRPPASIDALREDIDSTRARMSRTLDRIEDRVVGRRNELWSKATFQNLRKRISSEPWRTLIMAFAAGYILAAIRD